MHWSFLVVVVLSSSVLLSCSFIHDSFDDFGSDGTLRVWVEPDFVDRNVTDTKAERTWSELVMDGCRYWEPKGVRCRLVSREHDADVRVTFDRGKCLTAGKVRAISKKNGVVHSEPLVLRPECRKRSVVKTDDYFITGISIGNGVIVLSPACMRHLWGGKVNPTKASFVVAHEIGHELGIRDHVPPTCDDKCVEYRRSIYGGRICGDSVMNPEGGQPEAFLATDGAAFDEREPGYALSP